MAIEFVCPSCNGTLQVGDDAAGRVIRCGGCMTMLRVPGGAGGASPGGAAPPSAPVSPFESPPPPPSRRSDSPADVEPLPDEPRRRRRDRDDYDDDDRSRRRRDESHGEPAPAPGRSALLWLLGIGAVGFILVLGCCAGLFLNLPKEKWETHESPPNKGGFKVSLPAQPKEDVAEEAGIGLRPGTKAEGTSHVTQYYMVLYREIPSTKERVEKEGRTDEKELAEAVGRLLNRADRQPVEKSMTVGGFPAKEVSFRGNDGRWYTARVIVADTRLFVVLSCGTQSGTNASVRKFLDSFAITDPALVPQKKDVPAVPAPPAPGRDDKD